ncbi:hypothetical protein LCGC14_2876720, partial [marine sediment metagenome]
MSEDQVKKAIKLAKDIQRLRDDKRMYGNFRVQTETLTGLPVTCPFDPPKEEWSREAQYIHIGGK